MYWLPNASRDGSLHRLLLPSGSRSPTQGNPPAAPSHHCRSQLPCAPGTFDTKNMVSLVHGAQVFYLDKHFCLEPPSLVFMVRWSRVDSLASFTCFRHHPYIVHLLSVVIRCYSQILTSCPKHLFRHSCPPYKRDGVFWQLRIK
jgi:hypothetical protein